MQDYTAKATAVFSLSEQGTTPRQYLNSQEKVLYESRPSFTSVVSIKLLAWLVIGSLIFLPLSVIARGAGGFVLLLWFLVTILPVLVAVLRWRGMFFTLTDQRIMSGHGVSGKTVDAVTIRRTTGLLDVQTARVTEVIMDIPMAGRIFGYGNIHFQTNVAPILWHGVKHVTDVRRFVDETLAQNQEVAGQELAYKDQVTRTVAGITAQQRMGFMPQKAPYQASAMPAGSVPTIDQPASLPDTPVSEGPGMKYCVNCGTRVTAGTKFCPECGTAISQPQAKKAEEVPA